MALHASRIRVPVAPKSTISRCKSTVVPAATSSMVDAKLRVREHARNISRTTVSKATPAPVYEFFVTLFSPSKLSFLSKSAESSTWSWDPGAYATTTHTTHIRSWSSTQCTSGPYFRWSFRRSNFPWNDAPTWCQTHIRLPRRCYPPRFRCYLPITSFRVRSSAARARCGPYGWDRKSVV